ncbi:Ribonuclease H-like protein [Niveomyces insectorum RCEF 264]|uniref:ribonuclease H n=1 Tax=Niveomyces insectorum RCEF 264 TaxID=1081102 RepID=A0A167T8Q6_9HYPO|nr:Ribonuclease H-like protein [Niveomyces insectorum RCEF 264]
MPTLFTADGTPGEEFPLGWTKPRANVTVAFRRFVHRRDKHKILIYTDGTCLDEGKPNARAGAAIVFREIVFGGADGRLHFRLENQGPSRDAHPPTTTRAELRAVLCALQYRCWFGENVRTLVLATKSDFVANGCTGWALRWEQKNWRTSRGAAVQNKDFWIALLAEFRRLSVEGVHVQLWRIPRELNEEACIAALQGTEKEETPRFSQILGAFV